MKPPYLPWASGEFRCGTDVAPQSNSLLDRLQLYFAQRGAACKRVARLSYCRAYPESNRRDARQVGYQQGPSACCYEGQRCQHEEGKRILLLTTLMFNSVKHSVSKVHAGCRKSENITRTNVKYIIFSSIF